MLCLDPQAFTASVGTTSKLSCDDFRMYVSMLKVQQGMSRNKGANAGPDIWRHHLHLSANSAISQSSASVIFT